MRSGHNLGGWRCRLNLSMFLLTTSVGRFWSVQSVLEFNAIKKNLRIMSDIERVFWTVLFRMASRVFVFEQIELQAKLLNYFLGSNKSNINQFLYPERLQSRKELVCM